MLAFEGVKIINVALTIAYSFSNQNYSVIVIFQKSFDSSFNK